MASFVNPHDIVFAGAAWDLLMDDPGPDDTIPEIDRPPSQDDPFDHRPTAQKDYVEAWPKIIYEQASIPGFRRLYHYLIKVVDTAIMRILDALEASGMANDTIVVFTSDHGDLLGSHGGMVQKWHNAFDESLRVPLLISGPGIDVGGADVDMPTSHVDLLPTLLGLAGIDPEEALGVVSGQHYQAQALPGRDLSALLAGVDGPGSVEAPVYFMTEDQFSRGLSPFGAMTGEMYDPAGEPANVESVIATLDTGPDGGRELWKLNHYYERLPDWEASHGVGDGAEPETAPQWELYNVTADAEERTNLAGSAEVPEGRLRALLDHERETKRRVPTHLS